MFPKGPLLVGDVSRAILKVTEGDEIVGIERKWLGLDEGACNSLTNAFEMGSVITWSSLKGVFFITISLWGIAGIIYMVINFSPWWQGTSGQVQQAVAELVIEHANGDARSDTTWAIEKNSHLVLHLRGNPPPPPPPPQVAGPQVEPALPDGNGGETPPQEGQRRQELAALVHADSLKTDADSRH